MQFKTGDPVEKTKGYKFLGFVIGVVKTRNGKTRYVVENDDEIIKVLKGKKLKAIN
jgi:hypothetical protein